VTTPHGGASALESLLQCYFRDGDAQAFGRLIQLTQPRLLTIARRIVRSGEAEDAVQSVYYALMQRGQGLDGMPVEGWLVTAVVRTSYRLKSRQKRDEQRSPDLFITWGQASPVTSAAMSEELLLIRREVERLPPEYRDAVVLHYDEGLSLAEIAELVESSVPSVKMRLHRARAHLRDRLEGRVDLELFGLR